MKDNVNSRSRKSMSSFETRLVSSTRELPLTQVRRPMPGCLFNFDEQSSLNSELLFVRLSSLFSLIILLSNNKQQLFAEQFFLMESYIL